MNEHSLAVPAPEPAAAPAEPAGPRPGARLAAARAAQGLTVTDVARQLRLSPLQVEAIEADDAAKLPGPVFARGFVRNYARLVNLDPAILLDEPKPLLREPAGPQVPPALGAAFPSRRAPGWSRYALIGALVLTLAIAWQVRRDEPAEIAQAPVQPVVVETAAPPVAAEPAPVAEAAAPASATGERVLTLRFSDECWVEAVDRGGAKLVSQIYARGSEARIAAPGPFEVVLGNAAVARATLDDQPFDLAPHVKVNVARFTVQ